MNLRTAQPEFVVAEGISCRFGGLSALEDVSFRISKGETIGFIGPNGSGKTTLFNILSGIYRPTSGKIYFDGHLKSEIAMHTNSLIGIARTFQNPRVFNHLSDIENVVAALPHIYKKPTFLNLIRHALFPNERGDNVAREILRNVSLQPNQHEIPVAQFPYGKQRLVEVARALAMQPKILLLDEPTAGMNAEEASKLAGFLRIIKSQSDITILVIEHDFAFIENFCDRVLVLNQGRLIFQGRPEEAKKCEDVTAAYLGEV